MLRDYPQPMFDVKNLYLWGKLIGAEQEALKRGKSSVCYIPEKKCTGWGKRGESYKAINPSNYEMGENLIKLLILVTMRWGESYKTINPSNYEMGRIL